LEIVCQRKENYYLRSISFMRSKCSLNALSASAILKLEDPSKQK
jgi:hypothetical protein